VLLPKPELNAPFIKKQINKKQKTNETEKKKASIKRKENQRKKKSL